MAKVKIGGDGLLFSGEDKSFRHEVLDRVTKEPIDMSLWSVKFVVRYGPSPNADLILEKDAILIGTFNASQSANTQRWFVDLTDTELTLPAGTYYYSWKRMDDGSETILGYGEFVVEETTQG